MSSTALEPALASDDNPREYAKLLTDVHRATLCGGRSPAVPRRVVQESWDRSRRAGLRVDRANRPQTAKDAAFVAEAERLRARLLPVISPMLDTLQAAGTSLVVLADPKGRVVWRHGIDRALMEADGLGFTIGAVWRESTVGTNAIGTAIASRHAVQVHGAEHYCLDQHAWSCAATPIFDPRTQRILGVLDFSSDVAEGHPSALAMVAMLGQHVSDALKLSHQRSLESLRRQSWEFARGTHGPWIVADRDGWVAAASGLDVGNRLRSAGSARDQSAPVWVSGAGWMRRDPLPGGWLLTEDRRDAGRTLSGGADPILLELESSEGGQEGTLRFFSPQGSWTRNLPRRLAQILRCIALAPEGVSARTLSESVFGGPGHEVSVRAEISRARRRIGALITANPYRFAEGVSVRVIDG